MKGEPKMTYLKVTCKCGMESEITSILANILTKLNIPIGKCMPCLTHKEQDLIENYFITTPVYFKVLERHDSPAT